MNDDDNQYVFSVELRQPERPTVKISLGWPERQETATLLSASVDLADKVITISDQVGGKP